MCRYQGISRYQPGNFLNQNIGRFFPEITSHLKSLIPKSSNSAIASKLQESRIRGILIEPFDNLDQSDADYLNRLLLQLDLEVVRRLYREKAANGDLIPTPKHPYDHLPVGVAIAAATRLMRDPSKNFALHDKRLFKVCAEKVPFSKYMFFYSDWVKNKADKRCRCIKDILNMLDEDDKTLDGLKTLLEDEFGIGPPMMFWERWFGPF